MRIPIRFGVQPWTTAVPSPAESPQCMMPF
jgi:hypothetical protein